MGYSPWGGRELDTTERLRTHARVNKASTQTVLSMSLAWFSVLIHSNSVNCTVRELICIKTTILSSLGLIHSW